MDQAAVGLIGSFMPSSSKSVDVFVLSVTLVTSQAQPQTNQGFGAG
jgi:hypothetical protein